MTSAWRHGFLLACLVLTPFTAEAGPVKMRISTQLPINSPLGVNLVQFKEEVEAKSGGAMKAYVETVPVDVTDGKITITFSFNIENPQINGIEIIPRK